MKGLDNRSTCSEEKKNKIREAQRQTSLRRVNQVCKTYECKIVEKRLNKRQREELKMLFVEGKWFYNHMLNLHKDMELREINVCKVKEIDHFDKNHNLVHEKLNFISAA